jgi:ATP-binding cassette, subfamily B, bacterial MsbA
MSFSFTQIPRSFRNSIKEIWEPYSQLIPFLKPYRGRFIIGLVCGALAGIVSGMLAFVTKYVMDHVFPGGGGSGMSMMSRSTQGPSLESMIWICATIPAIMIIRSTLTYLNAYCMAWVSLKLLVDIRTKLFGRIIGQSLDFFNKTRAGNLISRVHNDTRMAQQALTQVSSDVMCSPLQSAQPSLPS